MAKAKDETATAADARAPLMGQNIDAIVQACKPIFDKMDKIEKQREDLTAQQNECIAKLEAKGLNRHAAKFARRYAKLDADKRNGFDVSFDIARRALGLPIQGDFFDGPAAASAEQEGATVQ